MHKILARCLIAGVLAVGALVVMAPAPAHALATPAPLVRGTGDLVQSVQYYSERRFYGGPRYYGRPRHYTRPRFYGPGPRYYARRGYYGGPRYYEGGPGYYGRGYYR